MGGGSIVVVKSCYEIDMKTENTIQVFHITTELAIAETLEIHLEKVKLTLLSEVSKL